MVGRNGSGKSTLLRIIAGLHKPDAGDITQKRDLQIGYLPQDFALDETLNAVGNVRRGAAYLTELIHEFENLPADSKKHHDLEQLILAHDGWNLENRLATAMARLNCPEPDREVR